MRKPGEVKILVAMSGGVDSTGAAYILREQGYEVAGAYMQLAEASANAQEQAEQAAQKLGIPFHVLDLRAQFKEQVMEHFTSTYLQGRTPNPCYICNNKIKFGIFYEQARKLGYTCIATGHYAKVGFDDESGRWLLYRSANARKDQSYFLSSLKQDILSNVFFPLEDIAKEELRKVMNEEGFANAQSKDSQDICFVPDGNYIEFIKGFTGEEMQPGIFVDTEGNTLGTHKGIAGYTIGQRKGVGANLGNRPLYVISKNPDDNTIVMGDDQQLYSNELYVKDVNLITAQSLKQPMQVTVKHRYNQKEAQAIISPGKDSTVRVQFSLPQRAVTPGQVATFYDGNRVVGGGIIC